MSISTKATIQWICLRLPPGFDLQARFIKLRQSVEISPNLVTLCGILICNYLVRVPYPHFPDSLWHFYPLDGRLTLQLIDQFLLLLTKFGLKRKTFLKILDAHSKVDSSVPTISIPKAHCCNKLHATLCIKLYESLIKFSTNQKAYNKRSINYRNGQNQLTRQIFFIVSGPWCLSVTSVTRRGNLICLVAQIFNGFLKNTTTTFEEKLLYLLFGQLW